VQKEKKKTQNNAILLQNTTGKIDKLNTHIHNRPFSWLGTDTPIKSGRVKLNILNNSQ
jgi:hypothetical protein